MRIFTRWAAHTQITDRLNSRDLQSVLSVCGLLSCVEYAGGSASPLFPMLNSEKIRVFADATVHSRAAPGKGKQLRGSDMRTVLNGAHRLVDDDRLEEEVRSGVKDKPYCTRRSASSRVWRTCKFDHSRIRPSRMAKPLPSWRRFLATMTQTFRVASARTCATLLAQPGAFSRLAHIQ